MKNNKNINKTSSKTQKQYKNHKNTKNKSKIIKNKNYHVISEKNYRRECGLGLYKNFWKHSANQFGNIGIEYKNMAAVGR